MLKIIDYGRVYILKPWKDLDYIVTDSMIELIKENIILETLEEVKLDLTEVSYINSIGISGIISVYKFLKKQDKKMTILNPNAKIKKILYLTKINEIINIEGENDEK